MQQTIIEGVKDLAQFDRKVYPLGTVQEIIFRSYFQMVNGTN